MDKIFKKTVAAVLAFALVLAAMPIHASADTESSTAFIAASGAAGVNVDITSMASVADIRLAIQTPLDDGYDVTVTGTFTDTTGAGTLNIPSSRTVTWMATFNRHIILAGQGEFIIANGADIYAVTTNGRMLTITGGTMGSVGIGNNGNIGAIVNISGGTIAAFSAWGINHLITITGGNFISTQSNVDTFDLSAGRHTLFVHTGPGGATITNTANPARRIRTSVSNVVIEYTGPGGIYEIGTTDNLIIHEYTGDTITAQWAMQGNESGISYTIISFGGSRMNVFFPVPGVTVIDPGAAHTVTWNTGGGAPAPTQTSVAPGGSIAAPVAMTRDGYTFEGWYTDGAFTTPAVFPITNVTSDTRLYARWTAIGGGWNNGIVDITGMASVEAVRVAIQIPLDDGYDVTVTGIFTGATEHLIIDIPEHRTLTWKASYSGELNSTAWGIFLLRFPGRQSAGINGLGTLIIAEGANIVNTGISPALSTAVQTVTMTGGTIISQGIALSYEDNMPGGVLTITGGTITSVAGAALFLEGGRNVIHIFGGTFTGIGTHQTSQSPPIPLNTIMMGRGTTGNTLFVYTGPGGATIINPNNPDDLIYFNNLSTGNIAIYYEGSGGPYVIGTDTNLITHIPLSWFHTGLSVEWDIVNGKPGISYDVFAIGGTLMFPRQRFIPVPGVTVIDSGVTHTVTWDTGGGAPAPTQTSVFHGGSIAAPAAMTRDGYTFEGWYTDGAFTAPAVFPITNVMSDTRLYARWTAVINVMVTGVSLNRSTLSLTVGASETLTASIVPAAATNRNVTWSSSNNAVATVVNGRVTAVSPGTATITVITADGNHTATCAVTVSTAATPGNGGTGNGGTGNGGTGVTPPVTTPEPAPTPTPDTTPPIIEEKIIMEAEDLLDLIEQAGNWEIDVDGAAITIPHEVLAGIADIENAENIAVTLTVTPGGEEGKNLLTVEVNITVGDDEIEETAVPFAMAVSLDDFDLAGLNTYRIVAVLGDSVVIGGLYDAQTGIFTFESQITGEFTIVYVETLKRLTMRIDSPEIRDLAGNAPTQTMDVLPVIQDGRTLIPIRFVAQALGAEIDWTSATAYNPSIAFITIGDVTLSIPIGEITPELAALGMDVPAQIMSSRTMVPLRFVTEFFGAVVTRDAETRGIEIVMDFQA